MTENEISVDFRFQFDITAVKILCFFPERKESPAFFFLVPFMAFFQLILKFFGDLNINSRQTCHIRHTSANSDCIPDIFSQKFIIIIFRCNHTIAVPAAVQNKIIPVHHLFQRDLILVRQTKIFQNDMRCCKNNIRAFSRLIDSRKFKNRRTFFDSRRIFHHSKQPGDRCTQFIRTDPVISVRIQQREKIRIVNN